MSEKQPCEKPVPSSSHLLLKVAAFLATPDFPKSQSCRGPWWGPWKGGVSGGPPARATLLCLLMALSVGRIETECMQPLQASVPTTFPSCFR